MSGPGLSRRSFVKGATVVAGAALAGLPTIVRARHRSTGPILGHGDHRYRAIQGWASDVSITVRNCHEMVQTRDGRLFMFGDHTDNNMVIFNEDGRVLDVWGKDYPGGHGLTLSEEGDEEFLYLTDPNLHQVFKTTLAGKVVMTLDAPLDAAQYDKPDQYKPTETAIAPNGDIYVADGYGSQYLIHYAPDGTLKGVHAGPGTEPQRFNNMHGVAIDARNPDDVHLILTARAQNRFKRFNLDGTHRSTVELPGAWICRPVIRDRHVYFAVIISALDSWQSNGSGFVAVLDEYDRVVSCPGGSPPTYESDKLSPMAQSADGKSTFIHPHDVCVDRHENLYIPQWNSRATLPIKLERV